MQHKSYPFSDLPFPTLFQDYIRQDQKINRFFETSPFNPGQLGETVKNFSFDGNRSVAADQLAAFNRELKAPRETLDNIEKLRDEKSLAVVTGQQLTLYGGPLFTVFKILTAISLADKYEKEFNRPVIPVFWLADEDHDAEEISAIGLLDRDELIRCTASLNDSGIRAGELPLQPFIDDFRDCIDDQLPDTDFTRELLDLLDNCYSSSQNVSTAFAELLLSLFGKHGLVLAGSNSDGMKTLAKDLLRKSVTERETLFNKLTETTHQLVKGGYHGQVHLQQSNLFYIDDRSRRVKIQYDDGKWFTDGQNATEWSDASLADHIQKDPNRFSPNVFLRPLVQDTLLPVISYVAGPGEIAYYAQMKQIYPVFNKTMPQIMPRFSGTIIESGIERIIGKLPFKIGEYSKRIEDLESQFIEQAAKPDLEKIFGDWKNRVDQITTEKKEIIDEIDPTLKNTAGKASATYYSELDKLKGKLYRSLKQQEKTQLDRISKIKANLFPGGNLQEREVAFIYFMNKYGVDLWDHLLNELGDEVPDSHKLIYL